MKPDFLVCRTGRLIVHIASELFSWIERIGIKIESDPKLKSQERVVAEIVVVA